MKSILVPTDFSECSENAINYAMNLAKEFNSSVTLLNAFHVQSAAYVTTVFDLNRELKQNSNNRLNVMKNELKKEFEGINVEVVSSFGRVLREISDELDSHNYDLIVMGTNGASGLKEFFIGSVASNLIGTTEVPTMVIPAGTSYVTPETMTLVSDLIKLKNYDNIKFVSDFARKFQSKVNVINVHDNEDVYDKKVTNETLNESLKIEETMEGLEYHMQMITAVSIESVMLNATKLPNNILTIIHRERSFLTGLFHKSLSKKLAMHATTPLLILQDS